MKKTTIQASLEFIGDKFDTDYVTALLNKEPDCLVIKGEIIKTTMRKSIITVWGICVEQSESMDMDTHLVPIFEFIENRLEQLKLLKQMFDAEWQINIFITIRNENVPGMVLSSKQIKLANAIEATIDIDLYVHQY